MTETIWVVENAKAEKMQKSLQNAAINEFRPSCGASEFVVLTVDEYEVIRLIDKESFSRE